MEIKVLNLLIISKNIHITENILEAIEDIDFNCKVATYFYKDILEASDIFPQLIVLDYKNNEDLISNIEYIKCSHKFKEVPILIAIEEKMVCKLDDFMKLGIKDYIIKPWEKIEAKFRLKNMLEYVHIMMNYKRKEVQFNSLFNNIPLMAWIKDNNSNYVSVNEDFINQCGKQQHEIKGNNIKKVWNDYLTSESKNFDLVAMEEKRQVSYQEIIKGVKGYREFNIYKAPIINEYDEVVGTVGVGCDITEIKNNENKLNMIIDSIPFGVWVSDINGSILNVNDRFLEYVGYNRDEILGACIYELQYNICSDTNICQDNMVINSKKSHVFKEHIMDNGHEISIEIYRSPVLDISNEVIGIVGLIRDVTEIRKTHDEIRRLAYTDFLTDLPNRQGLYNYINSNFNDKDSHISMLFIDLDNFKRLNDKYGSYYGDTVLLAIAEALKVKCSKCFMARTGGDEFVVVFKNITDFSTLKDKVDEIFNIIKVEIKECSNAIKISSSIGVVSGFIKENSLEKLLIKGDLALLKAKEKGKNQYIFYTDRLESENIFNLQIEEDLKNAISNNEIVLFYQPQFTSNKELKGFEALFRWKNKKYKNVPVIDIIKIIEAKGLIDSIGTYIIKQAAIFAKKVNIISNKKIVVSVNISAIQLMDDNFLYKFMDIIEEVGVDPEFIGIELTETVLLEEIEKNIEKLKYIKKMGATISLDDFGTGYSSLNYLIKLPISELKIDKSFVQSIETRDEYVKLIKLMSDIGHLLNLKVVVEGVEEDRQLEILRKMNIDYIQGYLFSKPVPEEIAIMYVE